MSMLIKKYKAVILIILCLRLLPANCQQKFNNVVSEYYQDGFLWNPALAGTEHIRFYGLFSNTWTGFEGSAKLINFSFDMPFSRKMGAGIILSSFSSGVFDQYTSVLSYAYQITFTEKNSLRLGGGMSFYKAHLDTKQLSGSEAIDPVIAEFNGEGPKIDGNLGAYLQLNRLSLGVTGYNLSNYFQKSNNRQSDWEIGQIQASYLIPISENDFSLKPLLAYQLFYSSNDIFLSAIQLNYQKLFHASLCWESTGSIIGGLGLNIDENFEINLFYTSKNKYGYQEQYEAGIKYIFNQ